MLLVCCIMDVNRMIVALKAYLIVYPFTFASANTEFECINEKTVFFTSRGQISVYENFHCDNRFYSIIRSAERQN